MNFQIGTSCSSVAVEIPVRGKKVALIFADDQNFIHASLCVLEQGGTIGLVSRTEAVSVLAGELQKENISLILTDYSLLNGVPDGIEVIQKDKWTESHLASVSQMQGSICLYGQRIDAAVMEQFSAFYKRMIQKQGELNFVYDEQASLYSFLWLAGLLSGNSVTFSDEICAGKDIYMMSVSNLNAAHAQQLPEDAYVMTFGEEIADIHTFHAILKEKRIKWIHIPVLSSPLFVSKMVEETVMGHKRIVQKLMSIDRKALDVVNQNGRSLPPRVEGKVVFGEEKCPTAYRGIRFPDGSVAVTGRVDSLLCVKGAWISYTTAMEALRSFSQITDCIYYEAKRIIFCVSNAGYAARQVSKLLCDALGSEYASIRIVVLPYLPYAENGNPDFRKMEQMTVIDSETVRELEAELSDDKHLCGIYESYLNCGKELDRKAVNKIIPQEYVTNVEQEDAWISGGEITFEECGRSSLYDVLKKAADTGKGIRYIHEDGSEQYQTYQELLDEALRIAAGFQKLGIHKGDIAIFQTDERKGFLETFWACMMTGVIFSPLETASDYDDPSCAALTKLININSLLRPKLIVTEPSVRERMHGLKRLEGSEQLLIMTPEELKQDTSAFSPEIPDLDETALIMFTSGSTGMPKGVMLTQRNLIFRSKGTCELNHMTTQEISLNWLPLTHVGGIVMFHLRDTYTLAEQIQVDVNMILKNPLKWLDFCDQYRVTMTWSPLFAFSLINKHIDLDTDYGWDLSSIKNFISGGEANVAKTLHLFLKNLEKYGFSPDCVVPAFGMTETSSGITYYRDLSPDTISDSDRFVPCGEPLRGIEIRITEQGNIKKKREVGDVEVRGTTITKGYYHNDQANADSFTEDGFFKTGDRGYIYQNILVLTGREKDIIIINGVNYFCQDIEDAVEMVDGVEPTCSIACGIIPHGKSEEDLAIFFVPKNHDIIDTDFETGKEVISRIRNDILQKFHLNAKYIMPVDAKYMEKTDIGKRQRSKIRKFYMDGAFEKQEKAYCHRKKSTFFAIEEYFMRKNLLPAEKLADSTVYVFGESDINEQFCECLLQKGYKRTEDLQAADQIVYTGFFNDQTELSEEALRETIHRLINLSKTLDGLQADRHRELFILLKHTFFVDGDEQHHLNNGILRGTIKGMDQEIGNLTSHMIDIGDAGLDVAVAELSAYETHSEVIYRHGERYVYAFRSIEHDEARVPYQLTQYQKFILITGGTGGVGYILTKRLAEKYQANILVIGTKSEKQVEDQIRSLNACGGHIIYQQADVCDLDAVDKAIQFASKQFESKLSTIIHCAGKFRSMDNVSCDEEKAADYLLKNEDVDSFYAVASPKIMGTVHMEMLREKYDAGALAVVSSLYGYFGGTAVSRYTAPNAFQQAFCRYMESKAPNKIFSIAYGEWENTGMSGNMSASMKKASASILHQLGFEGNDTDKSVDYFEYLSSYVQHNALVGVDRDSVVRRSEITDEYKPKLSVFGTDASALENLAVLEKKCENVKRKDIDTYLISEEQKHLITEACGADLIRAQSEIRSNEVNLSEDHKKMLKIWEDLLDVKNIGIFDNFFDLGGNSLLISKLLYEVESGWNCEVDFQALISDPTVDGLVKAVSGNSGHTEEDTDLLDCTRYLGDAQEEATGNQTLFVTGSTGFVGVYLISSLLQNDANVLIYAFVRAETEEKGLLRLQDSFEKYGLTLDSSRIKVICGDLSKDKLGLSSKDYDLICNQVDVIYHNGAHVNFLYTYDQLKKENVEATGEIIRIATTGKRKKINFVSSLVVYGNWTGATPDEDSEITREYDVKSAYSRTKHDAEYLIAQARTHGVKCNSFRIARTSGDSKTGRSHYDNYFWLMLKLCIEVGASPEFSEDVVMFVPVDVIAGAIAVLGQQETDDRGHNYNLYDDRWDYDIFTWVEHYGYRLKKVSLPEWIQLFRQKMEHSEALQQYAALPELITQEGINSGTIKVSSRKTMEALKRVGFSFRCMDEENLFRVLDYFVKTGFIQPPQD